MPKSQPDKATAEPAAPTESGAAKAEATGTKLTVEYSGETYELYTSAGGDVELMEDTARLGDGDISVMPRIVERLLGPKQYLAFKNKHRNPETGVVPMDALRELWDRFDTSLGE